MDASSRALRADSGFSRDLRRLPRRRFPGEPVRLGFRQGGSRCIGGDNEFAASCLGQLLPVAVEQGTLHRIEQVQARLEAGALELDEGRETAERAQVVERSDTDLAQLCR